LNKHDYVVTDFGGMKSPDSISLFRHDFLLIPAENLVSIQQKLQDS
jgi:hypothetical protein